MARIKGTDSHGKVHWFREIRGNFSVDYAWDDEIHASQMPLAIAEKWVIHVNQLNHYRDPEDRIEPILVKEYSR